ncbi:hypothetical protein [Jatrophihabitans sp.]|uniref:DUF6916 family protein n=1 Tax=Jatrophihabitans sp. TaxID=1932789 RepID=UPI0030C77C21
MDAISTTELMGRRGQSFTIAGLPARLAVVSETAFDGGGMVEAVFVAEQPHRLEQGTYPVGHAELATIDLFVVPSSASELCVTFTWLDPATA